MAIGVGFLRHPRIVLPGLLIFLLLQDLTVALAGGRASWLGGALQNLDEAGLLVVAGLATVVAWRRRRLQPHPWHWGVLGFLLAACVSIVANGSGWTAGLVGLLLVSKGYLFALAVDQTELPARDAVRWLGAVCAVVLVVVVFAVPDLLAPVRFRSAIGFDPAVEYRGSLPSVVSLAGHPGGYGWLVTAGFLIALAAVLTGRDRRWLLLAGIFLLGLFLSFRRKPIIGIAVALLASLSLRRGRVTARQIAIGAGIALLVLVPSFLLFWPILREGMQGYLGDSAVTTQARTALYAGAYLLAKEHFPLGAGVGVFGSYGSIVHYSDIYYRFGFNAIYGMSPAYPNFIQDTFWPQILGETGVLGLLAYGGAMMLILRDLVRSGRATTGRARWMVLAAFLILVETLFESGAAPSFSTASQACLSLGLARFAVRAAGGESLPDEAVNG
jgi:hypothetical protein